MRKIFMIPRLHHYTPFVGKEVIARIKAEAEPLKGKKIAHINSVAMGGGVAEILNSLVLLMNDAGLRTGWRLLRGSQSFFEVTKKFHNALQGDRINLSTHKRRIYHEEIERNAMMTHLEEHDLIKVHDPQPLALIDFLKKKQKWIWRCHIDITRANRAMWKFISRHVKRYDGMVVSSKSYCRSDINTPQFRIPPSIDPLSLKNREMTNKQIQYVLSKNGIHNDKPILCLVSRYDKWKNHMGVLKIFKEVKKKKKCQLVFIGSSALDDPESIQMFDKIRTTLKKTKDVTLLTKHDDTLVNALQRKAQIVYQLSIREGFGLTASEALWKNTPVIASNVGGLPLQVKDGQNGFIVNNEQEAVKRTLQLLENKHMREELGRNGKEYVRRNFLITRHLLNDLQLFDHYINSRKLPAQKTCYEFI